MERKYDFGIKAGIALLFCGIICCFSALAPWVGDALFYCLKISPRPPEQNLPPFTSEHLQNFEDIIKSNIVHWQYMNGRFIAHVIVQTVSLYLGKTGFAVVNALAYVWLVWVILRLAGIKRANIRQFLAVWLLVFICLPTKMIPAFQIGYIWMYALTGTFLIYYFKASSEKFGWFKILCLALLSICAGNSQESLSIPVGGALIITALPRLKRLTAAEWIMLISYGAGGLALCFSPASLNRVETTAGASWIYSIAMFCLMSRGIYILAFATLSLKISTHESLKRLFRGMGFFIIALAIALIFNFAIKVTVTRQLYGMEFLSIILTMHLFASRRIPAVVLAVAGGLVATFWVNQSIYLADARKQMDKVLTLIHTQNHNTIYADTHAQCGYIGEFAYFDAPTTPICHSSHLSSEFSLRLYYRNNNDIDEGLTILPEYLEGKDNVRLETQARLIAPNTMLVVQRLPVEDDVIIKRDALGGLLPMPEMKISGLRKEYILYQTPYWRAYVFEIMMPMAINREAVIVKK